VLLDKGQGGAGNFAPAVVGGQGVPAAGDLDDLGDAGVALLLLVGGVGDGPRDGVRGPRPCRRRRELPGPTRRSGGPGTLPRCPGRSVPSDHQSGRILAGRWRPTSRLQKHGSRCDTTPTGFQAMETAARRRPSLAWHRRTSLAPVADSEVGTDRRTRFGAHLTSPPSVPWPERHHQPVVSRSASGLVSAVAWRVCAFPGLAGTLSRRAGASLWLAGAFCGLAVPSSRRSCRSGGCSAGAQIRGQLVVGWRGRGGPGLRRDVRLYPVLCCHPARLRRGDGRKRLRQSLHCLGARQGRR